MGSNAALGQPEETGGVLHLPSPAEDQFIHLSVGINAGALQQVFKVAKLRAHQVRLDQWILRDGAKCRHVGVGHLLGVGRETGQSVLAGVLRIKRHGEKGGRN